LAPLDRPLDTGTLIEFLLALAVVGAVIAWELRNILTSDVPRLRAVQTVAARIVTMSQMLTGLIVLGLVAKVVFGAVQTAVARREGAAAVRPTAAGRDDTQQPDARADRSPTAGG
jgi:hypothetical protein